VVSEFMQLKHISKNIAINMVDTIVFKKELSNNGVTLEMDVTLPIQVVSNDGTKFKPECRVIREDRTWVEFEFELLGNLKSTSLPSLYSLMKKIVS
jgi:hypothetical protein